MSAVVAGVEVRSSSSIVVVVVSSSSIVVVVVVVVVVHHRIYYRLTGVGVDHKQHRDNQERSQSIGEQVQTLGH